MQGPAIPLDAIEGRRGVAIFDRFRRRAKPAGPAAGLEFGRSGFSGDDREHLRNFLATRRGVEAYIEPATNVTPWTVVLVAHDGEWTRRPCDTPEAAQDLAAKAGIAVYDVSVTGYPPRMREWTSARKKGGADTPDRGDRRRPTDEEMPPDPFA